MESRILVDWAQVVGGVSCVVPRLLLRYMLKVLTEALYVDVLSLHIDV